MQLSGFQVSIHSDGQQLKEYSIEVSQDGKTATCWIPCQTGKEFIVKYGDEQSSTIKGKTKSVHVFIDGHKMTKRATLPHHTQRTISGVYTTGSARRPFVFTEIRTADEGTTVDGDNRVKLDEMGIISVQVFLAGNWRQGSASSSRKYEVPDHTPAVINPNQRPKKAAEHCVSLGNEQSCPTQEVYHLDYNSKKPEMVFEFYYRLPATLQALGIIPPPKPGTPSWFVKNIWKPLTPRGSKALRYVMTWLGSGKF